MTAEHVDIAGAVKRYGATSVLDGVDLAAARGAIVTLLGPSGCGKTTLLRLVAGLATPDAGRIAIAGRDVTRLAPHKRNVGVVFQSYALFPHLTVAGNVGFGLQHRGLAREDIRARVARALDWVQLGGLADRAISALSGGQQQRVALARALAVEPAVVLFDEALSALDRALRESMQIELRRLLKSLGATSIFVTHDQDEALTMSDRVAVMNRGRIEQYDEPQAVYLRPATLFAMRFVGVASELSGVVKARDGDWLEVETRRGLVRARGSAAPGERVVTATRPEQARIAGEEARDGENVLSGKVRQVVFHGARTRVAVDVGEAADFIVETRGPMELPPEGIVNLRWPAAQCFAYPEAPPR